MQKRSRDAEIACHTFNLRTAEMQAALYCRPHGRSITSRTAVTCQQACCMSLAPKHAIKNLPASVASVCSPRYVTMQLACRLLLAASYLDAWCCHSPVCATACCCCLELRARTLMLSTETLSTAEIVQNTRCASTLAALRVQTWYMSGVCHSRVHSSSAGLQWHQFALHYTVVSVLSFEVVIKGSTRCVTL